MSGYAAQAMAKAKAEAWVEAKAEAKVEAKVDGGDGARRSTRRVFKMEVKGGVWACGQLRAKIE